MRAAVLFIALVVALIAPPAAAQTAVPLSVTPLPLNPEDRAQTTVGDLLWRGGFALTATDDRFGGLSDLELSPDGRDLIAVTDQGRWLTARLTYDAGGHLSGITDAQMGALRDPRGLLLSGKTNQDAEALARLEDGSLLVAFERRHRLLRYPPGNLAGVPQPLTAPRGLAGAPANGGIEALLALPDGRLLAFAEGQRSGDDIAAYLRAPDGRWHDLALKPRGLYVPTGAALLPGGDILLLERRYTLLGGASARLSRIPLASIRAGTVLHGDIIAELAPPLTLDNFEGVAVHRLGDGTTRITLISDDNFSALQRTLIVQFELQSRG